jgi:hypothetical protein
LRDEVERVEQLQPALQRVEVERGADRLDEAQPGDDPRGDPALAGQRQQPAGGRLGDERVARHRVDRLLARLGQPDQLGGDPVVDLPERAGRLVERVERAQLQVRGQPRHGRVDGGAQVEHLGG